MTQPNPTHQPTLPPRPMAETEPSRPEHLHWAAIPVCLVAAVAVASWVIWQSPHHPSLPGSSPYDPPHHLQYIRRLLPLIVCILLADRAAKGRWRWLTWPLAAALSTVVAGILTIVILNMPIRLAGVRSWLMPSFLVDTLPAAIVFAIMALLCAVAGLRRGGEIPRLIAVILIADVALAALQWTTRPLQHKVGLWVYEFDERWLWTLEPGILVRPLTWGIGASLGAGLWLSRRRP